MNRLFLLGVLILTLRIFAQDPSQWLCNEHIIISEGKNGFNSALDIGDMFGISVSTIKDINGDGINEILVGNQ
ncbi:MAG: hypothetical protein KDC92_12855, partial [Bacteroidetes bacterium]|nr:hypothetical protein [Bacteroidota bacterium]